MTNRNEIAAALRVDNSPSTGRIRKNTRRWCRGHIGLDHVTYDEKLWEMARQDVIQWRVRCKNCRRVLDWKLTDLNGQPKPPPKCLKCGRESRTLHAITKICRKGHGCALDEFYASVMEW